MEKEIREDSSDRTIKNDMNEDDKVLAKMGYK